jgi:demethylmacrocin O-methyltransferase
MTLKTMLKSALKHVLGPTRAEFMNRVYVNRRGLTDGGGHLAKLATIFGSDKWGSHWYAQHYQRHFAPLRWKRLILLEIGIGGEENPQEGGGSLRAWKWFFPRGRIVGIDIYDKKLHDARRIRTYKGSQADAEFLRAVIAETGAPDIIIDDGSHRNEHVIASFEVLFPLLREGGIYVVEDMQTSYWPKHGGGRGDSIEPHARPSMEFFKSLSDGLNHAEYLEPGYVPTYYDRHIVSMHFYHNLLFIYKGLNDEGSNCVKDGVLQ